MFDAAFSSAGALGKKLPSHTTTDFSNPFE
jgi:hypothetical protein